MSNAPTSSPKSGDSRRRSKSRGGKSRSSGSNYNNRAQRSEEFRPQGPRPPRNAPVVPLSWWQKLLQAIGLYKAPTAKSQSHSAPTQRSAAPTKSNTRNARSGTNPDESPDPKPKRTPRSDSRSRGGNPATVESARVYVGNLSYDVTEHDLEELFKGVGGVRGVEIVYNRATHRSKGYGFVEMLHKDEAMRSVEVLHDQPFMGRKLIVSGAKARGTDDRDEQDGRSDDREERIIVAPVPAAAVAATVADEETTIETVVETFGEEEKTA